LGMESAGSATGRVRVTHLFRRRAQSPDETGPGPEMNVRLPKGELTVRIICGFARRVFNGKRGNRRVRDLVRLAAKANSSM
jgi:hypothetical protein